MASLTIVGPSGRYRHVTLSEPDPRQALVLAFDSNAPRFRRARHYRTLTAGLNALADRLRALPGAAEVVLFKSILTPPGRGHLQGIGRVTFDLVLLIWCHDAEAAARIEASDAFQAMRDQAGSRAVIFQARNVRRIGPVDHSRPGVFLFNWFAAQDVAQNLAVWEHTAGWFQDVTHLDNSTVWQPVTPIEGLSIVNHCRWDRLRDILPALIFRRSFRSFVLANFAANRVAARPILYRMVTR